MMHRAAFLGFILGLAGCGGPKAPDGVAPEVVPALIEVKNQHALPVSIDITGNGTRYHLGTVHPGMRGSFKVPVNVTSSGSVELVVTPSTNARPFTSGPLLLGSAAVVDLIVTARLFNSTASIRP